MGTLIFFLPGGCDIDIQNTLNKVRFKYTSICCMEKVWGGGGGGGRRHVQKICNLAERKTKRTTVEIADNNS